jgi:prepilin-type N-terminal cleavage/methylation domain-containing protein
MQTITRGPRSKNRGFTLIEMMIAMLMLTVAMLAVAKLVPFSMRLNQANREDSTSLVLAQNEMNQFIAQPLANTVFTDTGGNICTLGNPATPNQFVGSPVVAFNGGQVINFGAAQVPGYSYLWFDPNDPTRLRYDVRWAVYTLANGAGRRFIVGVRAQGGDAPLFPVNLDSMVEK